MAKKKSKTMKAIGAVGTLALCSGGIAGAAAIAALAVAPFVFKKEVKKIEKMWEDDPARMTLKYSKK
jgi:hypothetical protein